jgi:uncharacterized paraquat-inducible protein A
MLAALGGVAAGSAPPIGLSLIAVGLCLCLYQGVQMWRERRDPYDLSRLWEDVPVKEEPEEDAKFRNMILCHRCGASMSAKYSICPQCGVPLGQ